MISLEVNTEPLVDFDPFAGNPIEKVVPATESQKEIFASCVLGATEASLAYNESLSLNFTGPLKKQLLTGCLDDLMARHESLRASFNDDGSKMIIYGSLPLPFHDEDLAGQEASAQQLVLQAYHRKDAETEFDLLTGPLIRFALFRLTPDQHLLTISAHHIICDGWSFGILLEDLSRLYNAKVSGAPSPDRPVLFSDYAVRSGEFQHSQAYKATVNYWKKEYEGTIPVFEIPPDFPRPPVRTYKSRRDDFVMPAATAAAIKKAGAKYGSSFVNTLMAAFEILLFKYTGHQEIVIGLPTAGQAATEMYDLVGHCVNLLPLRSKPDPRLGFSEYLKQRKSKTLRDYEHQQFTFGTFLKELKIQRDPSRMPLVPVSFNIDMGMDMRVAFKDLDYKLVYNQRVAETFELFLNIADDEAGYVFQWSYNAQLYKPSTIKGLMDKYLYLLLQITGNTEQKIADLQLEDAQKLAAYWQHWNNRIKKVSGAETIISKINQVCLERRNDAAVSFKGEEVSYREIYERSNQMAHYLIASGVLPGSVVGIAMERGIDLIISILGVLKSGGVFLPLDPQYARERIEYMISNSEAGLLLTSSLFSDKLQTEAREICVNDIGNELSGYPVLLPEVQVTAGSLVYILYTSGSTGKPKGVMIANKSLVNYISWAVDHYLKGAPGVFPLYTSISFDLTITSIFSPLVSGSLLKIYEEEEPATLLERIFTDEQVNVIKLTPSHLRLVKDSDTIRKRQPDHRLRLIVGGEDLETSLAKEVTELCKGNVEIYNEYGPTEATVGCMIHEYTLAGQLSSVPIGIPIANARIYLLDDALHLVSKGVTGEIYIGGDCVAQGYYKNEALTLERFLEDPFLRGGRMYKTGDNAVMLENDVLLFKGRVDDQVKLRGYRIEPGEIDYHLSGLTNIRSAITVVREDHPDNGVLVSYVVLQEGATVSDALKNEWREALVHKLPDYMVPALFVVLEELPLTTNGKIDKKKLPAPELPVRGYIPPETSEELLLADIWSELFGREQVGVYDHFFELGGHSLLAVRMIRTLEKKTGISLAITAVFRYPVLRDLAAEYARKSTTEVEIHKNTEVGYLMESGPAPLDFAATEPQLEIWQECLIGGPVANISYNVSHAEYLEGSLDVELLQSTLQELMNRHELLKATFSADGATIHIHPDAALPFSYEDISNLGTNEQTAFINAFLEKEIGTPFDLEKSLLFRIHVLKLHTDHYLFSLVIHHLICDGASLDTLISEIGQLYNNYRLGPTTALAKPVLFSAYAKSQQLLYNSKTYKEDINYWASKFEKDIPVLELPLDYPYPATRSYKSNIDYYSVDKTDTARMETMASGCNSTLTIFLRALFDILLYKYTGQEEFVIGLPVSDHINDAGFSLVGHSVNMLPVRSRVTPEISFSSYLKQRNEAMLNDYEHRHVTFGSLLKNIRIKRSAIKNTLISVSFGSQMEKAGASLNLPGIRHQIIQTGEGWNHLELSVDTYKKDDKLHFQVIYRSDLLKPATVKELIDRFIYLMKQVIQNPDQPIARLKLADESKILSDLQKWSGPFKALREESLIDLWNKSIKQYPDNIAIQFNEDQLTYRTLGKRVDQLCALLLKEGVTKGDIIGIALQRGPWIPAALLAVLKCGAVYVPIDTGLPDSRIKFMLNDAGIKLLISSEMLREKFADLPRKLFIEDVITTGTEALPPVMLEHNDSAYILYTSGSTGTPKGVEVTHGNLVNLLTAMQSMFRANHELRLLSVTTISFDIVGVEMYLPLICGGKLILTTSDQSKNGNELLRLMQEYNVNFFQATPATYKMMLEAGWEEKMDGIMITCGEPLTRSLANSILPKCAGFYNMYGPTETTIYSTGTGVTGNNSQITIGRPIQNTSVYIVDKDGNLLPANVPGEICIGGDGVARGYYHRPELTTEKFVANPFSAHAGKMFKTGDVGRFTEEGEILYMGRQDHQVKLRGYRIEPGEIDWQFKQLGGIRDVITVLREDRRGDPQLVAYIVPEQTDPVDADQLKKQWRNGLRKLLPDYMVPGIMMLMAELPLTGSGKIDKNALPAPVSEAKTGNNSASRPLSDREKLVKRIWEEELGVQQLSLSDDFFELGGNSLVAIKLMARIKSETGISLPISVLFEHSSLEAVSGLLNEQKIDIGKNVLIPIKTAGTRPPIYFVHGGALNILLYKLLEPYLEAEQPLYGIQALGLDGDLSHLDSIESIASRYLSEILAQNPAGPYILFGYSYGGVLVYEMARQLKEMGKEVKLLGILDTNVSDRHMLETQGNKFYKHLKRQLKKSIFIAGNLLRSPGEVIRYQRLVFNRKFSRPFKDQKEYEVYDYSPEVIAAYDKAYYKYEIQPLDIVVHLFRVKERIYFVDDPLYLGWKKYASGGVIVHNVTGDHKTFLLPPNNEKLVHIIQKSLK